MHTNFADWLRTVRPEVDNEIVLGRWAVVEAVSTQLSPDNLLVLLHFAATTAAPPPFFVEAVQKHDAAFPIRDNANEFRLLAAATLINVISTKREYADAAALAFICLNAAGLRGIGPIRESLAIAERHLFERGRDLRTVTPPDDVVSVDLKRPLAELTAAFPTLAQAAFVPLGDFMSKLTAEHSNLVNTIDGAVSRLYDDVCALREQLDIVWWVFGGRLSSGRAFVHVELPELTLLLATDLDQLTTVIPGPVATRGYIRVALQNGRQRLTKVSLKQAVDAMDINFLAAFEYRPTTKSEEFICAISYGLNRRSATGNEEWSVGFQQETDIKVTTKMETEDLAYLFYCERLLIRELGALRS